MSATRVEELRSLVKDIKIAMLTTCTADGHLVSRPMALQKELPGADLWFVTLRDSGLVQELRGNAHLNLSFYKDRTKEYVSISGTGALTQDRALIEQLWAPDWKLWFEDEGGDKDGSARDPRLMLIGVTVDSAHFLSLNKPQPLALVELIKSIVTRQTPELGETQRVTGEELRHHPGR